MKTTAANFKKNPQKHYRAADLGETVTINHDRYPDKVFEMIARDRNPLQERIAVESTKGFHVGQTVSIGHGIYKVKEIDEFKPYIVIEKNGGL